MEAAIAEVATPRWGAWFSVTAPTQVVYAESGMLTDVQKAYRLPGAARP